LEPLLIIDNLHVSVGDTEVLKGVNLTVNKGEIHAIMGPNGSGKSTLVNVIAGKPGYDVTGGRVIYQSNNLLEWTPDRRAREGIFLAFQYPIELPGVRNRQFIKSALDAIRSHRGDAELTAREFDTLFKENVKKLGINSDLVKRSVNEGFSGGEKKRSETLQLAMLDPNLALLDETDSGLDIDALRAVSDGINQRCGPDKSMILVTHYQRMLGYIVPDLVHVLLDGRIVRSGTEDLARDLESRGYDWIKQKTVVKI